MRIARSHRIAAILNGARRPVPMDRIAADLEVSFRTVTRDLKFMRTLGLPIRSNQKGTYFTRKVQVCACCCRPIS